MALVLALAAFTAGCSSRRWHEAAWPDEAAPGDSLAALAPGAAVRIETREGLHLEGVVREVGADAVVLAAAGDLGHDETVPRPTIARIARAEGEAWSTEKTVGIFGFGALVLLGAVVAVVAIWGTPGLGN